MMYRIVAVVLLALAVSIQAQHHDSPCVDQQLASCQHKFNTQLGIQGDADWHDPARLSYAIFKIFFKGTDGLIDVCAARTKFYQCLGPTYYSCINPLYFLEHHFTVDQSYGFVGVMHSLHYACGGGLELSINNWQCILGTFQSQSAVLQTCVDTYNATIAADPTKYCEASQTFLDCYRAPFATQCSYNGESSYWACEYVLHAFTIEEFLACPKVGCAVKSKSSTDQLLSAVVDHEETLQKLSRMQSDLSAFAHEQ